MPCSNYWWCQSKISWVCLVWFKMDYGKILTYALPSMPFKYPWTQNMLKHPNSMWIYPTSVLSVYTGCTTKWNDIQIKICAEYRDMLPRPRLVCQEPGLRPIGLSPGVPDKSSRGLGSMSRYSAQILICFIAYIFLIVFIPWWVWLGNLQDCQYAQYPLPLSIVIRMRLVIRQSKLPACLAEVQLAHQNTLLHLSHSLVKMTDRMD